MSTPGAVTATCLPRLDALKILSSASVADTAITFGSDAGNSGGDFGPALPAAAISTTPFLAAPAKARPIAGSFGPAKLILMILAPRDTDHSRLFRMAKVLPSALLPVTAKARTARICDDGAAPVRRAWPAIS